MVLWVDDNDELRRSVAEHLRLAGHQVIEAASAEQALEMLDGASGGILPSVLLTDLRLPGQTGLELASALRQRPDLSSLPVLLVSSHLDDVELDAWNGDDAFRWLHKPFAMAELEAALFDVTAGDPAEARDARRETQGRPVAAVAVDTFDELLEVRPTDATSGAWWLRYGLAAMFGLAVVGGLWPWLAPREPMPELTEPPAQDVRRGGVIVTSAPFGPLAGPPDHFSWQSIDGDARYFVEVQDVAARVLWRAETKSNQLGAPDELAALLRPLAAYYWRVEARDSTGRVLATSDRVRFRIVGSDSDPRP